MIKEFSCIVCPNSCHLKVEEKDGKMIVTGNTCKRGETFALKEISHPERSLCTTIKTSFKDVPVLPVRINGEVGKEKIMDVMKEINSVTLNKEVGINEVIIKNILKLGVDVIATSNILKERK